MGKTTLLKGLLQQAIRVAQREQAASLPIFISLPDLAHAGLTLQTYLSRVLSELGIDPEYSSTLVEAVNEGQAFLCLDSLDEVVPAQRPDIIALINREAIRCGGTWIIGSRFTEYKGGQFVHSRFAEWELQPLDHSMRLELAGHLFSILAQHKTPMPNADDFVKALHKDTRIAAWGKNPLLFSLAAAVYVQTGMLPISRATLYHDIVTMMLSARTPDPHERKELLILLAEVALQLYQTKGRNFSVPELQELLTIQYPDLPPQKQNSMMARILNAGLLDIVVHQTYGFKHQMFQEYLVAVVLANKLTSQDETTQNSAWQFLWNRHTYSRWSEVLRLCMGVLNQEYHEAGNAIAVRWLHRLVNEHNTPDGDIGNLCLELALGSLREFPSTLSQHRYTTTMDEEIRTLLLRWAEMMMKLRTKQSQIHFYRERPSRLIEDIKLLDLHFVLPAIAWLEGVRDHGYQGLETYETTSHIDEIFRGLNVIIPTTVLIRAYPDLQGHGINLTNCTRADTLRMYAATEQLVRLLQDPDADWPVRVGAAHLLGEWDDQTFIPLLCTILEDTTSYYQIRIAVAHALGKQKEQMPVEKLVALLQDQDQDERIRTEVASVLINAGKNTPIEALLTALHNEKNNARNTIKNIFFYNNEKEQIPLEPLIHALRSQNNKIRCAAVQLLDSRIPIEQLLRALNDPYAEVRIAAIKIAGKMQDQALIPFLLRTLRYQDKEVYDEALQSLEKLGGEVSVETLIRLAKEDKMPGRALEIALKLQVTLPVDLLLATLDNQRYSPSDTAARLLARMGQQAPIAMLLDMLLDKSSQTRIGVAKALGLLAPHVPIEPISALLAETDPSHELYSYLVMLLLRSGVSLPTDTLVHILKVWSDEDYQKNDVIVTALSDIDGQAPINELLQMVPDQVTTYTRPADERVVLILKNIYTRITPERLNTGLSHKVQDERLAMKILSVMGKNAPIDFIKGILDDETRNRAVRTEARHALYKAGVLLPLHYFLAEKGVGQVHNKRDEATIATMRELSSQAPIEELLELLITNYDWVEYPHILEEEDTFYYNTLIYDTAIAALRELAAYLPLKKLTQALDHSNPLARKGAASVVGVLGERAPIDKLIRLLHNPDEKRAVRISSLRALANDLQPYTPVEAITAVLKDEDYYMVRAAIFALEKWGREIPLEPLLTLINSNHDNHLSSYAIRALGWLQDRAPVELLLALQNNSSEINSAMLDPGIDFGDKTKSATEALALLGEYAPLDILIARLYDNDGNIHTAPLETLLQMGEYAPLEIIWQVFNSTKGHVRHLIEDSLDNLARAAPAKFIALTKDNQSMPVRQALMQAIAKLGKDAPGELALEALKDEDVNLRLYAAIALLRSDVDPTSIPMQPLLQVLQEKHEEHLIHWSTRRSLAKQGVHISEALGEQAELSVWACIALGLLTRCSTRVPIEPVLATIGDSNMYISEAAAKTLYQMHPEAFAEVAQQAEAILRGETPAGTFASRVQSRVADTIKHIERATPEVLAHLSDLLDWPYWEVRMKAAQALGAVHRNIPDQAVRRLLELRHDPESQTVREAADEALTQILAYEGGIEDE